jgi:hypothetical protein
MHQRQAHVPGEILPGLVTGGRARLFSPYQSGCRWRFHSRQVLLPVQTRGVRSSAAVWANGQTARNAAQHPIRGKSIARRDALEPGVAIEWVEWLACASLVGGLAGVGLGCRSRGRGSRGRSARATGFLTLQILGRLGRDVGDVQAYVLSVATPLDGYRN